MSKKEEIVTETSKKIHTYCDICNKESQYQYSGIKKCLICGKDVCFDCAIKVDNLYESDLSIENNYYGDHPCYICKKCWSEGNDIRQYIMSIRNESEKRIEELIENWKELNA